MKALISMASAVVVAASFAFVSTGSSFESVSQAQADAITGGRCYDIVSSGCRSVLNITPDGVIFIGNEPGCGAVEGNQHTTGEGRWAANGYAQWCSDDQSWACGAVINRRPYCADWIPGTPLPIN